MVGRHHGGIPAEVEIILVAELTVIASSLDLWGVAAMTSSNIREFSVVSA